jgi:hypothetical protein
MTNLISIISKYAKVFFAIDLGIVLFCLLQGNMVWLLNTQIAFVSVLIIVIGSFLGYHRNISKQIDTFDINTHTSLDDDAIDKIEDPYDLYSEDGIVEEVEISKEEFVEIVKEEKSKLKKNSIKNTIKSASGFASIYRILGYILLVTGFFYLNNNGLFQAVAYVVGISVVPAAILVVSLIKK